MINIKNTSRSIAEKAIPALDAIANPYKNRRPRAPEGKTWKLHNSIVRSPAQGFKSWEAVPYDACPHCSEYAYRKIAAVQNGGFEDGVKTEWECKNCQYEGGPTDE